MPEAYEFRAAPGNKFIFKSDKNVDEFTVIKVLSAGASCIAYKVKKNNDTAEYILKEFCPSYLLDEANYKRENMHIIPPRGFRGRFNRGLQNLRKTDKLIRGIWEKATDISFHSRYYRMYEGYGTVYMLFAYEHGINLADIPQNKLDILSLLKIIRTIAKAIRCYHKNKILHLDIKPENFFIPYEDDTETLGEAVRQFDYNSLTHMADIKKHKDKQTDKPFLLPRPGAFIVSELERKSLSDVGEHTDIYEIAATLYLLLMRPTDKFDGFQSHETVDIKSSPLLEKVSPAVIYELENLFKKTLQVYKYDRWYRKMGEFITHLERIISLAENSKGISIASRPSSPSTGYFTKRKKELQELHECLMTHGYAFVKGEGGIGKTELVKKYVELHTSESCKDYHTVQFCKYGKSLKDIVTGLAIKGNIKSDVEATKKEYPGLTYSEARLKAKNDILHNTDDHTLIIVDNFNTTYDSFFRDFIPYGNDSFKVIFTTRCAYSEDEPEQFNDRTVKLEELSEEDCISLFCRIASASSANNDGYDRRFETTDPLIKEIVCEIDRNTLILVLLAKAVKLSRTSLETILERIRNQELDKINVPVFHESSCISDDEKKAKKIYAHLMTIFAVDGITDAGKEILKYLTLVSLNGISADRLVNYTGVEFYEILNLSRTGWIDYKNDHITIHPIIADLIAANPDIPKPPKYYDLTDILEGDCEPDGAAHIDRIMRQITRAVCLERRYADESPYRQAKIKLILGKLYFAAYDKAEAADYLNSALDIALSEENRSNESITDLTPYIYIAIGDLENKFGRDNLAISNYAEAEKLANSSAVVNTDAAICAAMRIGECRVENVCFDKALEAYERALTYLSDDCTKHSEFYFDIIGRLSIICEEKGYADKKKHYDGILAEKKCIADEEEYEFSDEIGRLCVRGEYFSDIADYEEFLKSKKDELGDQSPEYRDLLHYRWICCILQGEYGLGLTLCDEATDFIRTKYGEKSMEMAKHLVAMARLFPRMARYSDAVGFAEKAIAICDLNEDRDSVIKFRGKLEIVKCHFITGNITAAETVISTMDMSLFDTTDMLLEKLFAAGEGLCELGRFGFVDNLCLKLESRLDRDDFNLAYVYMIQALSRMMRGYYSDAENLCERASRVLNNMPECPAKETWFIKHAGIRARLWDIKGEHYQAFDMLKRLISSTPEENNELTLAALNADCGVYVTAMGYPKDAEKYFSDCEKLLQQKNIREEEKLMLYNSRVYCCLKAEEYGRAYSYTEQIVTARPDFAEPTAYVDSAVCVNMGILALHYSKNAQHAAEMFRRARDNYERMGVLFSKNAILVYRLLGDAYIKLNEYDKAKEAFETADKRNAEASDFNEM